MIRACEKVESNDGNAKASKSPMRLTKKEKEKKLKEAKEKFAGQQGHS